MHTHILIFVCILLLTSVLSYPINRPYKPYNRQTPLPQGRSYYPRRQRTSWLPTCTTRNNWRVYVTSYSYGYTGRSSLRKLTGRNGRIQKELRWRSFNVYRDPAFSQQEMDVIQEALSDLSDAVPCLDFGIWPPGATPFGNYVHIMRNTIGLCNSDIGKQGGRQVINLDSPSCSTHKGLIMHEMIHALGFHHEQARPDRDDYLNIFLDNVEDNYKHNFDKAPFWLVSDYGVPYNTMSIMHYGSFAFSANGLPTMLTKNNQTIPYDPKLQRSDIEKIQKMYGCIKYERPVGLDY